MTRRSTRWRPRRYACRAKKRRCFAQRYRANPVALLSHCQRGDEYLVGQQAHNYKYEAGGAAVLGSIQPQPIEADADGTLPLDKLAAAIKPDDIHFARTRLLSTENTISGRVLPQAYLQQAWQFTRERQLALHIDGARIFNAAVALNLPLKEIVQYCDTFTICLSKGLGAPVGSLLCGSEAFIQRALRWRKMTGGGLRQAGITAAAGLYAWNITSRGCAKTMTTRSGWSNSCGRSA